MKNGILSVMAVLLLTSGTALAGMSGPVQPIPPGTVSNQLPKLIPTCASGFAYSVKEQFGNPVTGHLWYICQADVQCSPGTMTANSPGTQTSFRFVYSCKVPPTVPPPACAPGFAAGSVAAVANIPGCVTPMLSCPAKFMAMMHTATPNGPTAAHLEYQCYRPG